MKPTRKAPVAIRLTSYFAVLMAMISLGVMVDAWSQPIPRRNITIGIITTSVNYYDHPIVFSALCFLAVLAGVVGLAILFQKRIAYDVAIAYSVIAIVTLGSFSIADIGTTNSLSMNLLVLLIVFGGFIYYLLRRRSEWKKC